MSATRGHVPPEKLDEYRALKAAADAVDQARHWYLTKGRNAPSGADIAHGHLRSLMIDLRVPIKRLP